MMTSKQTKIVATVSDKRCEIDFVRALYENGMNVVRMNSAHLNAEGFDRIINNVRAVSNTIAILMDTKGPEVRTTFIENDGSITFTAGDIVRMAGNPDAFTTHDAIKTFRWTASCSSTTVNWSSVYSRNTTITCCA